MSPIATLPLGRYLPGTSSLHRLDPRVKVLAVPLLVVAIFAATSPQQLGALSLAACGGWLLGCLPATVIPRLVWTLRWLFLFTLLVHLLFTPGHTLFGVGWLSADGLVIGLMTCWRLFLALLFAAALAATTTPAALAGALAWLLHPLDRLGLPVAAATEMVLLVLYFIPLLRNEALDIYAERVAADGGIPPVGYLPRGRFVCRLLLPLLLRLVDRGDELARRLAAGEAVPELAATDPLGPPRAGRVVLLVATLLVAVVVYGRLA
jgi:energy-coupling factor transport system permease protein